MKTITRDEMIGDYTATVEDISRLGLIVEALTGFIRDAHGEDRSAFRTDLMRYESLLAHATALRLRILAKLNETNPDEA